MDLTEALRLSRHEIVALVGGGGKTTTLFRLCHEATMRQRSYAACGTTRINVPPGLGATVISEEDPALLLATVRARLNIGEWKLVVGAGYSDHDRLLPVSFEVVDTIAGF